jgi:hypothetical protein
MAHKQLLVGHFVFDAALYSKGNPKGNDILRRNAGQSLK